MKVCLIARLSGLGSILYTVELESLKSSIRRFYCNCYLERAVEYEVQRAVSTYVRYTRAYVRTVHACITTQSIDIYVDWGAQA